jgi:GNAT superfamily N-acetyltransferase
MDSIVIRSAEVCEKAALESLQLRASLTNAGDREAVLAHPDAIDLPVSQLASGDVFVLELNGYMAGFAALESRPDGNTELDGLFVEPDIRRRGVGRSLVEHCARIALAKGARALFVIGNPHAEEFYISCGFDAIGRSETRFGPGLVMRKILLP